MDSPCDVCRVCDNVGAGVVWGTSRLREAGGCQTHRKGEENRGWVIEYSDSQYGMMKDAYGGGWTKRVLCGALSRRLYASWSSANTTQKCYSCSLWSRGAAGFRVACAEAKEDDRWKCTRAGDE